MDTEFKMTADDIAYAMEQALALLPEQSKVYTMPISNDYDQSGLLTRSGNVLDLQKSFFTQQERDAYDRFFAENNSDVE